MAIPLQASSRNTGGPGRAAEGTAAVTLCADDYAIAPGVSLGIREAIEAGRLNATGAMTSMPAWPAEARELLPLARRVDVGLHLNLTLGRPLTDLPKLAPGGQFPGLATLTAAALTGRLPLGDVRGEIEAQLDAFMDAMGRPPDFIDGHQHVQMLAGVRTVLFEVLRRRGLAGRLWLRDSADHWRRLRQRGGPWRKAAMVAMLGRGFGVRARGLGIATNAGFAGFSDFDTRQDYAALFSTYLRAPGPRHLIMCHPGYVDDALEALDPVTVPREYELAFLLSARFEDILGAGGVRLARFPSAAMG